MNKFIPTLFALLCTTTFVYAQYGVSASYFYSNNPLWDASVNEIANTNADIVHSGLGVSLDYQFRMSDVRVELLPELRWNRVHTHIEQVDNPLASNDVQHQLLAVHTNVHIYMFDLQGDCDCPTWSREGPTLKKGLFLRLSPGLTYQTASKNGQQEIINATEQWRAGLGAGLGFDIGLSDVVTVTPSVEHRWHSRGDATVMDESANRPTNWWAGIRLGIRPGKRRYR